MVSTGVKDIIDVSSVSIYPNPTSNKLEIELQNISLSLAQVSIIDISGQVLSRQNINVSGKNEIDVSELSTGLYFLMVQDEEESWVRKFVKE